MIMRSVLLLLIFYNKAFLGLVEYIVDSLFELYPYLFSDMEFIMELKSALYDLTVQHREEILDLLYFGISAKDL